MSLLLDSQDIVSHRFSVKMGLPTTVNGFLKGASRCRGSYHSSLASKPGAVLEVETIQVTTARNLGE